MPSSPHPHDARLLHLLRCLPFLHTAQGVERSCEDQIAVGYLLIQTPRLVLWPSGSSGSAARSTSTRFFVYRILSVSARRRLCSAVLAARRFAPAGRAMAYAVTPGWPTAPFFSCGREHLRRLSAVGSAGGGPEAFEARLVQLPLSEDVTQSRAATLRASATSPGLKTHRTHT